MIVIMSVIDCAQYTANLTRGEDVLTYCPDGKLKILRS